MNGAYYVNITTGILSLVLCLIILISVMTVEYRKEEFARIFISVVCCHIPALIADTLIVIFEGKSGRYANCIVKTAYLISFVFGAILLILLSRYLLTLIRTKTTVAITSVYISYAAVAVCVINIVCIILTQFNGMYYSIDEKSILHYGSLYWLSQFLIFASIVLNTGIILVYRKSFEKRRFISLLSYAALPAAALIIQNVSEGEISSINIAVTVTILIYFVGTQNELSNKLRQKELELAESRISIMLSQIQPHFLYNTLTTIETLCLKDGRQAAKLVRDFSSYLRENMDSLTQKELVSFERELTHVKVYLDIEKQRFEERLNVVFELEETDFKLPILTVQPLAENAVRYGVTKKRAGGTVKISTRRVPEGVKIVVSDDGAGFDSTHGDGTERIRQRDGRTHVGIANVRERLRVQCGGTLSVESKVGKGTICTIIIPGSNKT